MTIFIRKFKIIPLLNKPICTREPCRLKLTRWLAHQLPRAAYINLVSASDVASREYPAVSQMDVSVGKKGK